MVGTTRTTCQDIATTTHMFFESGDMSEVGAWLTEVQELVKYQHMKGGQISKYAKFFV